jgi:Rrf2 family protein
MLALTRKSDYALVALTHLAQETGRVASAREIADLYRVPLPILMNILKTLAREGMISSVRGARGGYKLARNPRDISLRMVVRAIEGPVQLFQCASASKHDSPKECDQEHWCPITGPARAVNGRLQEFLEEVSLEELAEKPVPVVEQGDASTEECPNAAGLPGQ